MSGKVTVAIHEREYSFSKRWVEFCQENAIPYVIVNCYDSEIISQLKSHKCNVLLWHWNHDSSEDDIVARHILKAASDMGLKTFPDVNTCCTFDDKVAQKYVLEAVDAPFVPSKVFLDKNTAIGWIRNEAVFPKVFKLRKGAGSRNIKLVRNKHDAEVIVKQAFGKGFKPMGHYIQGLSSRFVKSSTSTKFDLLKKSRRLPKMIYDFYLRDKRMGRESGYVLFQDFIPENKFDTRITIINGTIAFGFTRNVRENDFRASGSGSVIYDLDRIDLKCVEIAFAVARKLEVQSIAYDFVMDGNQNPWIIEVSYGFDQRATYQCPGYWDDKLVWHEGHTQVEDLIINKIIEEIDC